MVVNHRHTEEAELLLIARTGAGRPVATLTGCNGDLARKGRPFANHASATAAGFERQSRSRGQSIVERHRGPLSCHARNIERGDRLVRNQYVVTANLELGSRVGY